MAKVKNISLVFFVYYIDLSYIVFTIFLTIFMEFTIHTFNDLDQAAKEIIKNSKYKIFTLEGNLGSGKTTLIKAIGKVLGSYDAITSPTFSIVNEYLTQQGKIYHFDLYRINNKKELFDLGIEEYIYSNDYCFIEWPEIYESDLPEHHKISLILENKTRILTFN